MERNLEWGTLVLRIFLGIAFIIHGVSKFQSGIENIAGFFDSIGIPSFMAYIVATIELVGGVLLIAGIGVRYMSALFLAIMLGAIIKVKMGAGFLGNGQGAGYELDLAYGVIAIFLILNPKSSFSLDHVLFTKKNSTSIQQ
ncbi:DoxX family protein [Bacillus sp. 03113]|uniref:DoxX family protein n=1 Tax=Bacillus sp. 03113 TaxID=2578211 RepID=UPI001143402B|nr:DoxX family protein [Bacillus sp. 03113]